MWILFILRVQLCSVVYSCVQLCICLVVLRCLAIRLNLRWLPSPFEVLVVPPVDLKVSISSFGLMKSVDLLVLMYDSLITSLVALMVEVLRSIFTDTDTQHHPQRFNLVRFFVLYSHFTHYTTKWHKMAPQSRFPNGLLLYFRSKRDLLPARLQ